MGGSQGSFFDWLPPLDGWPHAFECNPPYDQMSITACFTHIASILNTESSTTTPLTFIVVVPLIDFDLETKVPECQPLVAHVEVVEKGKHRFLLGLQHRRTPGRGVAGAEGEEWVMQNHASAVFWLQ